MSDVELGRAALGHLERVVAIDSASDETSQSVPTTAGQARLADALAEFFAGRGAEVERDAHANVIASFPGVGRGASLPPVAFMIHLDTAPGTVAVDGLCVVERWDGERIEFPANPAIEVDIASYPVLEMFRGHTLVHGPGDAPFGLDDKLGLTHLMTLSDLIAGRPDVDRPPVLLIGRPDEEVGRVEALLGLADELAARGVELAYTVDGLLPYEVNVANFNAAAATLEFADHPLPAPDGAHIAVTLGGVNTHGATAKAEGHRPATRFLSEIVERLEAEGLVPEAVCPVRFECVVERDCDGTAVFALRDDGARASLRAAVEAVVGPHRPRGARFALRAVQTPTDATPGAVLDAARFIGRFLADDGVRPVAAEDSDGEQGYSQPHRITPIDGGVRLHVRIRDFDPEGLEARKAHVRRLAPDSVAPTITDQYRNMAPRLADHPALREHALEAARRVGVDARTLPIRGGTGVDPFLDVGVPVANLGTGYFAPESEKECTSLETMAGHARWLFELLRVIVERA